MLKINEIFYSLQGEGHNTGMPCIFIRFAGCNKKCSWCDTKHETYTDESISNIISKIKRYKCKNVIFTGGEPTIQDIQPLERELSRLGYWTGIETNGTNKGIIFDYITISPKDKNVELKVCEECKVVWTGKEDLKWFEDNIIADFYYLQPCSMNNIKEVVRVVKLNPKWRLSLQCQKLINIK